MIQMAPGPRWKSSVNELNEGFDNVRQHIDKLIAMDNMKKTVYSNPTTNVEVVVKTKKPRNDESWSSVLGQPKASTSSRPLRKKTTKKANAAAIKDQVDSKTKALEHQQPAVPHKFSSRTMQIFLKEMRLALKHQDGKNQIEKILDDLEFVAANLDPEPQNNEPNNTNYEAKYDLSQLKTELKKAKSDNDVLKRHVLKYENKVGEVESQLKSKDSKIAELNDAIAKFKSNGDQMLSLLSSRADIDEKCEQLERTNTKLQKELSTLKFNYSSLDLKNRNLEFENSKLKKVVE